MTRHLGITAVVLSSGLIAGCAGMGMGGGNQVPAGAFRLYSPAYADNSIVPRRHAGNAKENANCIGENVSIPLAWENAPPKTRSFALIMDDQAGGSGLGVSHWVAYGIPANVTSFAEGETTGPSPKYVGGSSSRKLSGYFGPCTPKGNAPQHYVFTMIATDLEPAALKPGLTRQELLAALKGRALRAASYVMRFVNP
jgi:Raf kinase inhibitor-like YbhB/YbcL family protein